MPAARGSEGKQALTIALVLFVLLSVILGIVAYFGYAEQAELSAELQRIKHSELALLKKDRDKERFFKVVYKINSGHGEEDKNDNQRNDSQTFKALRSEFQEEFKKEIAEMKKRYKDLDWPIEKEKPAQSYLARIIQLRKDLENENKKLQAAEKRAADAEKAQQELLDKAEKDLKAFNDRLKELQDKAAKAPEDNSKGFKDLIAANTKLQQENERLEKEKAQLAEESSKRIALLEKRVEALSAAQTKLADEKLASINMLDHDQPKGQIVAIDRGGKTVHIDLGSADRVKPGLTFSVSAPPPSVSPTEMAWMRRNVKTQFELQNLDMNELGQLAAEKKIPNWKDLPKGELIARILRKGSVKVDEKATLEVLEVLGPHLAKARVTSMRDAYREPLQQGDLLFNPAWSPTLAEHVAVAGVIDLQGDGRDQTAEFIRSLESQGIIVDAYVDLRDGGKEGAIKGKGISRQTTYLIEGDNPGSAKVGELKRQAVDMGVTVVPVRRFLAMMGYRMPRNTADGPAWTGYSRPGQLADDRGLDRQPPKNGGDKPPAGGAAPAPKEMEKKDPEKKEEK
jgi:hypothetical protein